MHRIDLGNGEVIYDLGRGNFYPSEKEHEIFLKREELKELYEMLLLASKDFKIFKILKGFDANGIGELRFGKKGYRLVDAKGKEYKNLEKYVDQKFEGFSFPRYLHDQLEIPISGGEPLDLPWKNEEEKEKKGWFRRNWKELAMLATFGAGGIYFYGDWDKDNVSTWKEILYKSDPLNPDTNNDGIQDGVAVKYGLDPTKSYSLLVKKAIDKDFPAKIVKGLGEIDETGGLSYPSLIEKAMDKDFPAEAVMELAEVENLNQSHEQILDLISKLPKDEQNNFTSFIAKDKIISRDEINQVNFLLSLDNKTFQDAINKNLIYDFNWDKDRFSNWFEKNISKTNYLSPNDAYVIFFNSFYIYNKTTHEKKLFKLCSVG